MRSERAPIYPALPPNVPKINALTQNAERLRATGRVEEAEEFEIQAQKLDDACDKQWRTRVEQSIVSRLVLLRFGRCPCTVSAQRFIGSRQGAKLRAAGR